MKKTLVIVGHPNYKESVYNKKLVDAIKDIPNVTLHFLKEDFNSKEEQQLITQYDNIVFQYPFHWFGFTPLFKSWLNEVLTFGFAYGPGGDKLENKNLALAITTASLAEAYTSEGHNKATIDELLAPAKSIIRFIRGNLKGVFTLHGCMPEGISDEELAKKTEEYKDFITSL